MAKRLELAVVEPVPSDLDGPVASDQVAQARDRVLGHDAPFGEDRELGAQLLRLEHVVGREEDRDPVRDEGPDQLAGLAGALRVEPDRRLVEEEDSGADAGCPARGAASASFRASIPRPGGRRPR